VEDRGAFCWRRARPTDEGNFCSGDGGINLGLPTAGNLGDHFTVEG
jgi:hypothetical protein